MTPRIDTKTLRRDEEGYFSVAAVSFDPLCDWCGVERCEMKETIERLPVRAPVRACRLFMPVLAFSETEGLDLPRWNTFRLGTAWAKRLRPGVFVAILAKNTHGAKIVRRVAVEAVYTGTIAAMCDAHAHANHLAIARCWNAHSTERLARVLRNVYGSIATADAESTVIYFAG